MKTVRTVCIYHANCFDGMAAAWVVKRVFPKAKLFPGQYGEHFPFDMYGKDDNIIIVDFSYPRKIMKDIDRKCNSILVLDHHKTAQANCEGLSFCKFDIEESGASLAWKHFFPSKTVPNLIRYIADRDLWQFDLPDSKYVNAYIQSYEMNIENYDYLYYRLQENLSEAVLAGEAIERYKDTMVMAICQHARIEKIGEHVVPVVMTPLLFSEVGHRLCQHYANHPFAASWFIREDGTKVYSLRSIGEFDVSEVAKSFGGGGHRNAAGFQVEGPNG